MRLFIGYTPPKETLEQLENWTIPLRSAGFPFRWIKKPGVHLTLHFLGDVPESKRNELIDSLDSDLSGGKAFPIRIRRLGVFDRNGSVSILWAGVDDDERLTQLHGRLGRTLRAIGFTTDDRPFSPHITLARPRSDAGRISAAKLDSYLDSRPPLDCRFDHLTLFSSVLSPQGARYRCEKEYIFD